MSEPSVPSGREFVEQVGEIYEEVAARIGLEGPSEAEGDVPTLIYSGQGVEYHTSYEDLDSGKWVGCVVEVNTDDDRFTMPVDRLAAALGVGGKRVSHRARSLKELRKTLRAQAAYVELAHPFLAGGDAGEVMRSAKATQWGKKGWVDELSAWLVERGYERVDEELDGDFGNVRIRFRGAHCDVEVGRDRFQWYVTIAPHGEEPSGWLPSVWQHYLDGTPPDPDGDNSLRSQIAFVYARLGEAETASERDAGIRERLGEINSEIIRMSLGLDENWQRPQPER
ncbi:hypothetical protein [Streptomyces sp. NPDC046909]|uniref:hypothetical protein n=1 Tax=Streptomyces sp. NPDC046909 TaxID=3155617 RepID=UPI003407FBD4